KEASEKLVAPRTEPDGGTVLVRYDRLLVTTQGDTTELGRLPDGAWVISRPARARADARAAEDIVGMLQQTRLNRVLEEHPTPDDLRRYGLQPPAFSVTASADGVPPLTVEGGIENSFDGSAYLRRAGDERVFAVDGITRTTLAKRTDELRAHDVAGVRDLGLVGVSLSSARNDWAIQREPEKPWLFLRPAGAPVDGAAVSQWVAAVGQVRAEKFLVDSPAERARTGVEKPAVDVTFRRLDETVRVRLAGGAKDQDPVYLLREDGFGAVLAEMPRSALAALDKPALELRDRTVLSFRPDQVERLRILPAGGGPPMVAERRRADAGASEQWQLVASTAEPLSTARIGTLLYGLGALKSLPVEVTPPHDAGLAHGRTIILEGQDGQLLATLVLGSPVSKKDGAVWTRNARGEVVPVDLRFLAIPAKPEDLMEPRPPSAPPGRDAGR
ncbi:MAG TPA: DUF4340 domain-containing protein, partial [Myxococcaceae bacterium]|nr:DUF4340 domain-containing protein [Myxococcaceae bacterium]